MKEPNGFSRFFHIKRAREELIREDEGNAACSARVRDGTGRWIMLAKEMGYCFRLTISCHYPRSNMFMSVYSVDTNQMSFLSLNMVSLII
jgi:hypothetical protein